MKIDKKIINVGDWVYSDSPGIWRVFRIIQNVQRMRFKLNERIHIHRERIVFSKRFVDNSWKPVFATEFASDTFVRLLSEEDRKCLEEFIVKNPQVFKEFEVFKPTEIDIAADFPLNVPNNVGKDDIQQIINKTFKGIETGITNDEILQRIAKSKLEKFISPTFSNATLQFISKNHEIRNNGYIFREVQLIMIEKRST